MRKLILSLLVLVPVLALAVRGAPSARAAPAPSATVHVTPDVYVYDPYTGTYYWQPSPSFYWQPNQWQPNQWQPSPPVYRSYGYMAPGYPYTYGSYYRPYYGPRFSAGIRFGGPRWGPSRSTYYYPGKRR